MRPYHVSHRRARVKKRKGNAAQQRSTQERCQTIARFVFPRLTLLDPLPSEVSAYWRELSRREVDSLVKLDHLYCRPTQGAAAMRELEVRTS
jgi:hypothetical protein